MKVKKDLNQDGIMLKDNHDSETKQNDEANQEESNQNDEVNQEDSKQNDEMNQLESAQYSEMSKDDFQLSEGDTMFSCFKCHVLHILKSDHRPQRLACVCGTKYRAVYRKGQLTVLNQK